MDQVRLEARGNPLLGYRQIFERLVLGLRHCQKPYQSINMPDLPLPYLLHQHRSSTARVICITQPLAPSCLIAPNSTTQVPTVIPDIAHLIHLEGLDPQQ